MKKRCFWVPAGDTLCEKYHDTEWGVLALDDATQFEFLVLESAQAGLSWRTILGRREGYRRVFADFDPVRVARFSEKKIETLMQDARIIRNRLKITATVRNARQFLQLVQECGSFANYLKTFFKKVPEIHRHKNREDLPAKTVISEAIAKDLKRRGFTFLGPTVMYAHLQATGFVQDHTRDCFRYKELM